MASPKSSRRGARGFRRDSITTRSKETMREMDARERWIAEVKRDGEEERYGGMEVDMVCRCKEGVR